MFGKVLACLSMLSLVCVPAQAGSKKFITKYVHYQVAGLSAPEIVQSMLRNGPSYGGINAYATTVQQEMATGSEIETANSCKVRNPEFQFTIKLPKLKNGIGLRGRTAIAWSNFAKFAKKHEERHRQIWLDCANKHRQAIERLNVSPCKQAQSKAEQMWRENQAVCLKRHEIFDNAEKARLLRQPLIRMSKNGN